MPNETSTVLAVSDVTAAKAAIDAYVKTAGQLYEQLKTSISGMVNTNFTGEAADGYNAFFTSKITPAIKDNLYADQQSLMKSLTNMMDQIQAQLINTVDVQLGDANEGVGTNNG